MSIAADPEPVLVMVSILQGTGSSLEPAERKLEKLFGPVGLRSDPFPFDLTDYYSEEMGGELQRVWLAFSRLQYADRLPQWKLDCSVLEEEYSSGGSRVLNLDPGYLDHGKLVLASFKAAPDKIYMGSGVYAHTCMRYRFGGFQAPDHSFPDFAAGIFESYMRDSKMYYGSLLRETRRAAD